MMELSKLSSDWNMGEPDFGEATNPAGQGLWRVTTKVLSNSKHTLLCL